MTKGKLLSTIKTVAMGVLSIVVLFILFVMVAYQGILKDSHKEAEQQDVKIEISVAPW